MDNLVARLHGWLRIDDDLGSRDLRLWREAADTIERLERELAQWQSVAALSDEQAEDDGLWFIAETAPEAYLQQELRRLHAAIDAARKAPPKPK